MIRNQQGPTLPPPFSIVIPVYNDWIPLERCLDSLTRQTNAPSFEVIVVDDGSDQATPAFVRNPKYEYPLVLLRQSHAGISVARNQGIRVAKGTVLLFVDADCKLDTNCLTALNTAIARSPAHDSFQLRLVGDCSTLVGRAEELRLVTFQNHMLQPDGRIRYLNTAGFAMRRSNVDTEAGVFDPSAFRAEDTLLLAILIDRGELPLFVPGAIVEHSPELSLLGAVRKDIWTVYLEGTANDIIARKGVKIRVTHRQRVRLLWSMWKTSGQQSIGRPAWFGLMIRQVVQRTIAVCFHFLSLKPASRG